MRFYVAALCALGGAAVAHGQLAILTATGVSGLARCMYYDMAGNTTTTLWNSPTGTQYNGYGLCADDVNGKLYYDTSARLGYANYGGAPLTPTVLGGHYYADGGTNATVAVGSDLTMANGKIYAWDTGSTTFTRGIYRVDPTVVGGKVLEYAQWTDSTVTTQQYDFQGLAYRAKDGLFYGVNQSSNHTKGIYSIDAFGSGAVNFVAALPVGKTHIDGATFDDTGDTMYVCEQDPSTNSTAHDGSIYVAGFDMNSSSYTSTYSIAYDDTTQRGTDLAFTRNVFNAVPEPGTYATLLLGLAPLVLRRRKR